jgi:anthranilate/para-aminobenzoate synthase component II
MTKKILVFLNNDFNTNIDYLNKTDCQVNYILIHNIINIKLENIILLINMVDIIILSGGPQHLVIDEINNYPEIPILIKIIKICDRLKKIVIGLCLGCQLIALTYDIKIIKLKKLYIGKNFLDTSTLKMDIIKKDKFLNKIDFNLFKYSFSLHNDSVCNFEKNKYIEILGYSNSNVPYIIRHKTRPIYGFQSHPEATVKSIMNTFNRYKINYKIEKIDKYLFKIINRIFFDAFIVD